MDWRKSISESDWGIKNNKNHACAHPLRQRKIDYRLGTVATIPQFDQLNFMTAL
jgi:hypothetical protein